MKYLTGIAALLIVAGTACKQKEQPVAAQAEEQAAAQMKFEFRVQRTGNSVSFSSVSGTDWKEASYSCKELPCEFTLSNFGVNPKTPATVFSIGFKLTAKEVMMTAVNMAPLKGPAWETSSFACAAADCKFTVNEEGVSGAK